MPRRLYFLLYLFLAGAGSFFGLRCAAQGSFSNSGNPITIQDAPQRDTASRSNSSGWRDEKARVLLRKAYSPRIAVPDTAISRIHQRPFASFYRRDLGNTGMAARPWVYAMPRAGRTGPWLGYSVYEPYQYNADSVTYYNTTRPYTEFAYALGSKLEQVAEVTHTQNINPRWNAAAAYRKVTSQGFYKLQRTAHDGAFISTNYKSTNTRYELFGALIYNKAQQDENGGILSDTFLTSDQYTDRSTVPVGFQPQSFSIRRSAITNTQREVNVLIQHGYTLGPVDTSFNSDSTEYAITLRPRFRIGHRLEAGSQRHLFKDAEPDSLRYSSFFQASLTPADSVYSRQDWNWFDNRLTLSGFLGKPGSGLSFSAGAGLRSDVFTDHFLTNIRTGIGSTYITGEIGTGESDSALLDFRASVMLFTTGPAAGNFQLGGRAGKKLGMFYGEAGASQILRDAPHAYSLFGNQYYVERQDLEKESYTTVYVRGTVPVLFAGVAMRYHLLGNYVYLKDSLEALSRSRLLVLQEKGPGSIFQVVGEKAFRAGNFILGNEVIFQQKSEAAKVNVPALMGRHTLTFESPIFKRALLVATGVEARWHTAYTADGYAPFYNRFYYQTAYALKNFAELGVFFNFKVKRFRAFLNIDQLQQTFRKRNTLLAPGYPAQDFMVRFGFNWVMIN